MRCFSQGDRVTLAHLVKRQEGDEVIIGRPDTGVFLVVPRDAAEVLEWLSQGSTVGEAAARYKETYGEEADLDQLLTQLQTRGLLESDSPSQGEPDPLGARPLRQFHFDTISQTLAQKLFSPPVLALHGLVILTAIALSAIEPELVPSWSDLYFPGAIGSVGPAILLLAILIVFFHEMAHLIAAKAAGVSTRLGIGNRLWIPVAEADMSGLWAVEPQRRYLPFLAGPLFDASSAATILLFLFAARHGWVHPSLNILTLARTLFLVYIFGLIFQCYLFTRTDFYYVLSTFFRCKSLLQDTEDFLRNQVARWFSAVRLVDQSHIPPAEMQVVRAYSVLWLGGRILALGVLLLIQVPLVWRYLVALVISLNPRAQGSADPSTILLTLFFLLFFALGLSMWVRSLRRAWR